MRTNHLCASIRFVLAFGLILLVGIDASDAQGSFPEIFRIVEMNATTDKDVYQRNEIIMISYSLECRGKSGTNKSFTFKENDSFHLIDDMPGYMPNVIFPKNMGFKTDKPRYFNANRFKRYYVPLFDNNSNNENYFTKITLNISPTLKCKLNRIYDLTDRSFVDLMTPQPVSSPTGPKIRIEKKILVINNNPEIISPEITISKEGKRIRFIVKDNDSLNINWSLWENGMDLYDFTDGRSGSPPLVGTANFSISDLKFSKLHAWDSDGGEDWRDCGESWGDGGGPLNNLKIFLEEINWEYSIFVLVVIALSFLSFNYLAFGAKGMFILWAIVLISHYIIFKYDFVLLTSIMIISIAISNYFRKVIMKNYGYAFTWTKIPGTDEERLKKFLGKKYIWEYTAGIAKSKDGKTISITKNNTTLSLTLNEDDVILKIDNIETDKFIAKKEDGELNIYYISIDKMKKFLKKLYMSLGSWMALTMLIIINMSSRDNMINYLFFSVALLGFPGLFLSSAATLKKWSGGSEWPVYFYSFIWVPVLILNITHIDINYYVNIENFLTMLYLAVISLNLLNVLVYWWHRD